MWAPLLAQAASADPLRLLSTDSRTKPPLAPFLPLFCATEQTSAMPALGCSAGARCINQRVLHMAPGPGLALKRRFV